MRVIGGTAKGKKLSPVPGTSTRPVLDRVKTCLFDILRPQLEGLSMLDLFAGTGAIGIEGLSQGAAHCVFLDLDKRAYQTINENLEATNLQDKAEVRNADSFSYLKNTQKRFDLIYIAPPQYEGLWIEAIKIIAERPSLLTKRGQIVVQIDPKEYETLLLDYLKEQRSRKMGNTILVFYDAY